MWGVGGEGRQGPHPSARFYGLGKVAGEDRLPHLPNWEKKEKSLKRARLLLIPLPKVTAPTWEQRQLVVIESQSAPHTWSHCAL